MPEDLLSHACIQIRTGAGTIYKWEFRKDNEYREIDVPGQVCVGDTITGLDLALGDVGITYCPEKRAEPYLASGKLRVVLPEWSRWRRRCISTTPATGIFRRDCAS